MLSVYSHLFPNSNSQFPILGAKSSKISKFCLLVKIVIEFQNYILLVNTSPGICSVFRMEPQITSYSNFTKIETSELTSKNAIANGGLFRNSEVAIEFVASKRVYKWSRFLISSPGWSCTQNETTVKLTIY